MASKSWSLGILSKVDFTELSCGVPVKSINSPVTNIELHFLFCAPIDNVIAETN